jgi:hypothetical protein
VLDFRLGQSFLFADRGGLRNFLQLHLQKNPQARYLEAVGTNRRGNLMSRSHRNTPIVDRFAPTNKTTVKRTTHRRLRHALHLKISTDAEGVLPTMRDVNSHWRIGRDGRSWIGRTFSRLMRK